MVVVWQLSERLSRPLVLDALKMALARRKPTEVLVHHSDRGSQFASGEFHQHLEEHRLLASMSRKGNCTDNAVAESFFASLKSEIDQRGTFDTRQQAGRANVAYVEIVYNGVRGHSTLGYVSPREFELRQPAA